MAWITDSLRGAINAIGRRFGIGESSTALPNIFTHQLAVAAYLSSGMMRKAIAIPADDRVREWRDWQTDKESIAKIEKEEKRLGLQAAVQQAELLRGIGGGALLLITAGDHSEPLTPKQISEGGIVAINVVSRWEIQARDFDRNLASPTYRMPQSFQISNGQIQQSIHPSRVICFRGAPLPAGTAVGEEEIFWGDSRLLRIYTEVRRSDDTQAWFSALVRKAKLLRVGIPNMSDFSATVDGRAKLDSRIALIAEGESVLNAVVYDAGTGKDGDSGGEKIDDYQITWAGIPAVMDAFDQRVAAVADIPFTRLMGRSPAGMNATGDHDTENWNKMVAAGQNLETRPCLEAIDPFLLRSAGVAKPDDVTWKWAPLWTPTEKEEAETFKTFMDGFDKVVNSGAIPERAFAEAFQNWMEEREYMPGLGDALAKLSDDERYGLAEPEPEPEPDEDDPSALQAEVEQEGGSKATVPFGDAKRRSKGQRLARRGGSFDPTQPRGRDGRWIPTGTRKYIDDAAAGRTTGKRIRLGPVNDRVTAKLKAIGIDTRGRDVTLNASRVRHTLLQHGNERRGGQRSVTGTDIASARQILNSASQVRRARQLPGGGPRFIAVAGKGRRRTYTVFETGKRGVTLVTMWVRG